MKLHLSLIFEIDKEVIYHSLLTYVFYYYSQISLVNVQSYILYFFQFFIDFDFYPFHGLLLFETFINNYWKYFTTLLKMHLFLESCFFKKNKHLKQRKRSTFCSLSWRKLASCGRNDSVTFQNYSDLTIQTEPQAFCTSVVYIFVWGIRMENNRRKEMLAPK